MNKKVLREKYKTIREQTVNREEKSIAICNSVISNNVFKKSSVVALYANTSSEVITESLLDEALRSGKVVLYPKVCDKGVMKFYRVYEKMDLQEGKFGILEPSTEEEFEIDKIDLFIVPGLAFDKSMNRLGYGGGYYDRYLEGANGIKVGLSFSSQICEKLDTFPHDVRLDYIVTEEEIIS